MMDVRQQKSDVMQTLLRVLLDRQASAEDRAAAKTSLRRIADGSVVETLSRAVDQAMDEELMRDLAEVISGVTHASDAVAPVILLLWHDTAQIRQAAMKSLARCRSKEAAGALAVVLADARQPDTIFDARDERQARTARDSILGRAVS